jgi:hypothetical protein
VQHSISRPKGILTTLNPTRKRSETCIAKDAIVKADASAEIAESAIANAKETAQVAKSATAFAIATLEA